jgi:hypothetical protein
LEIILGKSLENKIGNNIGKIISPIIIPIMKLFSGNSVKGVVEYIPIIPITPIIPMTKSPGEMPAKRNSEYL